MSGKKAVSSKRPKYCHDCGVSGTHRPTCVVYSPERLMLRIIDAEEAHDDLVRDGGLPE